MLYVIINPSDQYTIECPDHEMAAVACVILGEGAYGFEPVGEDKSEAAEVPVFFGGADIWFRELFGAPPGDVVSRVIETRTSDLVDALDSVVIGRRDVFLEFVPKEWEAFLDYRRRWHDLHRSSMNDIGGRAYALAAKLRKIDHKEARVEKTKTRTE